MFAQTISSTINHLMRENGWAHTRILPHAGKTARFDCPPIAVTLTIQHSGEVVPAFDDVVPDVTMLATPGLLLRLLAREETAWTEVDIKGDAQFAADINYLLRNLRWDAEADLSRWVGDVAAHRMTQTAKSLGEWREQAADNLLRAFAEYWTEEQPLIAHARDVEQFNRDVDVLRDDVARLEKRIESEVKRRSPLS